MGEKKSGFILLGEILVGKKFSQLGKFLVAFSQPKFQISPFFPTRIWVNLVEWQQVISRFITIFIQLDISGVGLLPIESVL